MSGVSKRKFLYFKLYINNLSNFSNGTFISDQSLDVITKTGNYRGANISELKSYITPSSWCGIKAYVQSDNAAFFYIITSDNIVINAYRDGDGTYKIYPIALKSDLSNMTKKDSSKFMPGDTVLDVSAWSAITLLSIVTYKDEATALYLIRKESSNKIYCIPVKSSTQVSVTHNGENKLTLSNSATYGGTWAVLFLS